MLAVVADARHHVGAAEALRILERGVGDLLAGLQIEQPEHDRGGAQVHRDAVDRAGAARDLFAIDQDAIAIARHRGVELESSRLHGSPNAWRSMRMWPRRMVWQRTVTRRRTMLRLAGEAEIAA